MQKIEIKDTIIIDDTIYQTNLTNKYKNRKNYAAINPNLVSAVIPGTIREIFKKVGQTVKEGEPVLILEAMKMRNVIASPRNGVIKELNVNSEQHVAKNHKLFEIE